MKTYYTVANVVDGLELTVHHWQHPTPKARLLIIHGFAEHAGRYNNVANSFQAIGCDVHGLDFRGHGKSPNSIANQPSNVRNKEALFSDIRSAITHINALEPQLPLAVLGHSMGGLMVAAYLAHKAQHGIDYAVLSSPHLDFGKTSPPRVLLPLLGWLGKRFPHLSSGTKVNPEDISKLAEEVAAYRNDPLINKAAARLGMGRAILSAQSLVRKQAQQIHLPLHVIHGDADALAAVGETQRFFEAVASSDKHLEIFAGGYHELFNDSERERAITGVVEWLGARL